MKWSAKSAEKSEKSAECSGDYDKAKEFQCGCCDFQEKKTPDQLAKLRKDLARDKYWSGTLWKDYAFYCCNWHPLLGIFLCHPHHPWSKYERAAAFVVSTAFTMLPTAVVTLWFTDWGKAVPENEQAARFVSIWAVLAFITVPVMLIEMLFYQLSVADLLCPSCCVLRACANVVKHCCFLWSFAMAGILVCTCWVMLEFLNQGHVTWEDCVQPFISARIQSWVLWFPLYFLVPCVGFLAGWFKEAQAAQEKSEEAVESAEERKEDLRGAASSGGSV